MENLFLTIVNMSITATWAVLAFTLLRPLLKKAPKWINCLLWGVVGLRLCLPFSFESVLSLIPTAQTIPSNITTTPNPKIDTGVGIVNDFVNPAISNSFAPDPSFSMNPLQAVVGVASNLWLVGAILMLIYSVVSYIILKRKVSVSLHYNNNVYFSDNIETPFILGVIKPKIYIPSGTDEADLQFILEHEKSHIKRKDYLIKPFSFLLLSVYWFNPAIWLWYILLCRDIESACDEKAIKFYDNEGKKAYSKALLNCSTQKRLLMACPVAFGETGVKQRIKSVLNYKHPAVWVIGIVTVIAIWLTIFFATNPKNSDFKNIIDEKGYEIVCIEPKTISETIVADNILNRAPNSDSFVKPRFRLYEENGMAICLDRVEITDDESYFNLTFSVEYDELSDWGLLYSPYYKNENGYYSYFLKLGDKFHFSDTIGDVGESCDGQIISIGPDSEFVVKVSKYWFEKARNCKITLNFNFGEITYKKANSEIEDELSVFLDTQLAGIFDSQSNDKNFNCLNYKILDEAKNGKDNTLYMTAMWQEYYYDDGTGLRLKREYHYPVLLTYQNDSKLFSKNGKSYKLTEYWVPQNDDYDEGLEFYNNFSDEAYNDFKENKIYYYTYHKNCCETSAKENFNVKGFGFTGNEPLLDIKDRFNFGEEYNVFNPERTVAINVTTLPENNDYQKVITDPKVIERLYDIVSNEIYSTKATKVSADEVPHLHGMSIILKDYRIYNSEPLTYCFDEYYLLPPYFFTPDGCYELESKQHEEIQKIILEATNDTSIDLTPLVNPEDIINHYDMSEYEISLSADWYCNKNTNTFTNQEKKQTIIVSRKVCEFENYYQLQKDSYNNALKEYGEENVTWNEKLGFTYMDGVSEECFYTVKNSKGLTVKRFYIYDNNVFLVEVTDESENPDLNECISLSNSVSMVGKSIYGGSARASKKQETTESLEATTSSVKLVTSDRPPENTTSPEGYTTPYVDYFTPEGEHVYEYYVYE